MGFLDRVAQLQKFQNFYRRVLTLGLTLCKISRRFYAKHFSPEIPQGADLGFDQESTGLTGVLKLSNNF